MTFKYSKLLRDWFKHSVWAFPTIILFLFIIATAFGVNGSSVGIYHKLLYGNTSDDPALLLGEPKSIRSDEFLIFTPRVASQFQAGSPVLNQNINSGREVVITPEAPIKDWVGIFRPHTAGYFIMPFSNAFAFSWWFGLMALIISSYFFFLRIFKGSKSKPIAILLSLSISLSPFIMWWFQISILLILAYFFMATILLLRLIHRQKIKYIKRQIYSDLLYSAGLIYIGTSMLLLLYLPFIVPISLVLIVFMVGYVIEGLKSNKIKPSYVKKLSVYLIGILVIVGSLGAAFYLDRHEMIKTINNSIYPGERRIASGELPFSPLYSFFDSFLMPLLPNPPTGSFYANQSEAANFIFLLPFLLLPGFLLLAYDYIKNKNINWILLLLQLLAVIFILRITVPVGDLFYKPLLLDRVPNSRLMIGLGLLSFLQLAYLLKYIDELRIIKREKLWTIFSYIFCVLILGWLLLFSKVFFSDYLLAKNTFAVGLLAILFTSVITCILLNKRLLGAGLLLIITVVSSYRVMPLQIGMPFFEKSEIVNKIREVSKPSDSWAVVDNFTFESLPLIAGRHLINGHQPYTDLNFWHQLDTAEQQEDIYNRQGHAIFVTNLAEPNPPYLPESMSRINGDLELLKGNVFKVKFDCSNFTYKNVDYILTTYKPPLSCIDYIGQVDYPKISFYIYKIAPDVSHPSPR